MLLVNFHNVRFFKIHILISIQKNLKTCVIIPWVYWTQQSCNHVYTWFTCLLFRACITYWHIGLCVIEEHWTRDFSTKSLQVVWLIFQFSIPLSLSVSCQCMLQNVICWLIFGSEILDVRLISMIIWKSSPLSIITK